MGGKENQPDCVDLADLSGSIEQIKIYALYILIAKIFIVRFVLITA